MALIQHTQINLELTEVGDIIITPVVQDEANGDWVRDIRIFSTVGALEPVMMVQIKLRSLTAGRLEVSAPAQQF